MWKYYSNVAYCVAYLADIKAQTRRRDIRKSDWFSRGWTLQELLAPEQVVFYNDVWQRLGEKDEHSKFARTVSEASGVSSEFLRYSFRDASVAQRMSWAVRRTTTREEDQAYCLMGLFEVHMPLLYGEGGQNAFRRLQKAIIEQTDDESIFAFEGRGEVLAGSPRAFSHCGSVSRKRRVERPPYQITHKGLKIEGPALQISEGLWGKCFILKLNCLRTFGLRRSSRGFRQRESQGCVLGLVPHGDLIFRHPGLEQAASKWTADEIQQNLEQRKWKQLHFASFFVSARDRADQDTPRDGDSAVSVFIGQPEPEVFCVDDEGPWYSGIRTTNRTSNSDD